MEASKQAVQQIANDLRNDTSIFRGMQADISNEFKNECNRFMKIKNSQILSVRDLDTIASNAAKNYLTEWAKQ